MTRLFLLGSALAASLLGAGCSSTTTRHDLRDARANMRDARAYGDREDRRDAREELRDTRRAYEDDHRCGPRYGRPC